MGEEVGDAGGARHNSRSGHDERHSFSSFLLSLEYNFEITRSYVTNRVNHYFDAEASSFYASLVGGGFAANSHIDALPRHHLLYVVVPKCASTTIKMVLSSLAKRKPASAAQLHMRRYSGLKSPKLVGISAFYRFATDPATLRFSFVRNPYARLVSAWADKFLNKSFPAILSSIII